MSVFENIFLWFKWFFVGAWNGIANPLKNLFKWFNWLGFVVFGFIWTVVKFTWQALTALYEQILGVGALYNSAGSAISGQSSNPFSEIFIAVNTFVPVDLFFAYLSLILQMWIFWNVYRFIKSWIPTVS